MSTAMDAIDFESLEDGTLLEWFENGRFVRGTVKTVSGIKMVSSDNLRFEPVWMLGTDTRIVK